MDNILLESQIGPVLELRLNRPKARNALSLDMMARLHQAIDNAGKNPAVHVVVLAAEGPAFCAGHDLKELTQARAADDNGRAFFERAMTDCAAMMQAIVACPKIIISSIQGVATAAGCQLVASTDLAVASEASGFATPGVDIGLFCSTPMVALSRNIGRKPAMEMLLTGEIIPPDKALQLGLVNRISTPEALAETTRTLAEKIASKAPKTLKTGKEAFYRQIEMPLSDAYDYAARVMVANLMERDAREGIDAFIGKRPPVWDPLRP